MLVDLTNLAGEFTPMEGDDVGSDPLLSEKDGEEMAGDVGGVPFLSEKDFEVRNVTGFSLFAALIRMKALGWRPSTTCHFAPF